MAVNPTAVTLPLLDRWSQRPLAQPMQNTPSFQRLRELFSHKAFFVLKAPTGFAWHLMGTHLDPRFEVPSFLIVWGCTYVADLLRLDFQGYIVHCIAFPAVSSIKV